MGTRETPTTTAALEWARPHFPWLRSAVETEHAWACTLRLESDAGRAYLKLLPPQQHPVVSVCAALARHLPQGVPALLASAPALGLLLAADHGGRTLDYDAPHDEQHQVLRSYAALQAQALQQPELLAQLPATTPIDEQVDALLAFLAAPAQQASGLMGAAWFIGEADAARYHALLNARRRLLQAQVALARALPVTLNHGDLRPPNAALTADGRCVLMDWDDAHAGPVGMSLHGMFSGVCQATLLLTASPAVAAAAAATPEGRLLEAYVAALAAGGVGETAALRAALPGALCLGVMHFIVYFGRFAADIGREDSADTMRSRLSDLLDLCDLLASRDGAHTRAWADDYDVRGEHRRARRLYQDLAARHPDDAPTLARLGRACRLDDDATQSLKAYDTALALARQTALGDADLMVELHAGRGAALLDLSALGKARAAFGRALKLQPAHAEALAGQARTRRLTRMLTQAAATGGVPVLRFDADRPADAAAPRDLLALGALLFQRHGVLQIDNAFPLELITRVQQAFAQRYQAYFHEGEHPDALRVGDKRYMLTVDMVAPFNEPALIGAPTLLPLLRELLGEECVLGAFTAVISLPGSVDQRLHKDHPALYPDTEWHYKLPSFAAQLIIPLVPLDEHTGTTRVYKGSHRVPTGQAEALGHQDPMVPLGSCLLTDYRCAHRGLGNRSQQVRPILTLIFNRPWFRDYANYGKQPPLRLPDASYEALPEDLQSLVDWWKEERLVDGLDHAQLS